MKYRISLNGCDDSTGFDYELTQEQYELIAAIAKKSEETSTYGCMPTLRIEEAKEAEAGGTDNFK